MKHQNWQLLTRTFTVKPALSGHTKRRPKIVFQDRLSLNAGQKYCRMLQESILQYFRPSLSYHLSLRHLIHLFLSCCLRQVLMYLWGNLGLHCYVSRKWPRQFRLSLLVKHQTPGPLFVGNPGSALLCYCFSHQMRRKREKQEKRWLRKRLSSTSIFLQNPRTGSPMAARKRSLRSQSYRCAEGYVEIFFQIISG